MTDLAILAVRHRLIRWIFWRTASIPDVFRTEGFDNYFLPRDWWKR